MRVFCSVTGSQGHARAMLPLAQALAEADHDVLVACPPHLADVFSPAPVRVEPILPDMAQIMQAMMTMKDPRQDADEEIELDPRLMMVLFSAGPHVSSTFRTLLPVARQFEPDLVLRDGAELAGCLLGEALGVPHVSVPSGAGNIIDPEGIVDILNERRREVGLPEQADSRSIYRHGRIDCMPAEYSFARYKIPDAFTYRQPMQLDGEEGLPMEFAELPADRPLVLASVGTALPVMLGLRSMSVEPPDDMMDPADTVRALVAGLSAVDCSAVVATAGFPLDGVDVGPNVHVVDWVPQTLLLQCTQLFITHCGYNGIREAVRFGVPMVTLPQFADQHHNAERVAELGLGLPVTEVTPEGVAAACEQALADDRISQVARTAQRAMLTLPSVQSAVEYLEGVVYNG